VGRIESDGLARATRAKIYRVGCLAQIESSVSADANLRIALTRNESKGDEHLGRSSQLQPTDSARKYPAPDKLATRRGPQSASLERDRNSRCPRPCFNDRLWTLSPPAPRGQKFRSWVSGNSPVPSPVLNSPFKTEYHPKCIA
jgi:hypothetical protein